MPLSDPAPRELLHLRDITVRGYRRDDGLFDIDAEIADTKTYGFQVGDRGQIAPGDKLHNMLVRMTVDAGLTIVACEAALLNGPFLHCPGSADSFARLAGLTIRSGFLREANVRLGGPEGCTHIRELLQQIATVAVQTTFVLRERKKIEPERVARIVDSCYGYAASGPAVKRLWPERYTGTDSVPEDATRIAAD